MSLAYSFNNSYFESVSSCAQTFVDNFVKFDMYKSCRDFVKLVNNKKLFTLVLLLLERAYMTQFDNDKDTAFDLELYNQLMCIFKEKMAEVKHYPRKDLKTKFLRIDQGEMEMLSLLELRFLQISENTFPAILNNIKVSANEQSAPNSENFEKLDTLPFDQKIKFVLGLAYNTYRCTDADILFPVTKKLIKNTFKIIRDLGLVFPALDFEEANERSSIMYSKALKELAN